MRLSFLQGLGPLLALSGMVTAMNLTEADMESADHKPYRIPYPYSHMSCSGWQLDKRDVEDAKEQALRWGAHNHVGARKVVWWDDSHHRVSWWICNCKTWWDDGVMRNELNDVLEILEDNCGKYQSGWVWSDHWEKGFNIEPKWMRDGKDRYELCPGNCLNSPN